MDDQDHAILARAIKNLSIVASFTPSGHGVLDVGDDGSKRCEMGSDVPEDCMKSSVASLEHDDSTLMHGKKKAERTTLENLPGNNDINESDKILGDAQNETGNSDANRNGEGSKSSKEVERLCPGMASNNNEDDLCQPSYNKQLLEAFLHSIGNEVTFLPTGLGINFLLNDVIKSFLDRYPTQHVVMVVVRPVHALELAKRMQESIGVTAAAFCGGDFMYDFKTDFDHNRILVITAGLLMRLTKLGTYDLQRSSLLILHDAFCAIRNHPMNTLIREYYWKAMEPGHKKESGETSLRDSKKSSSDQVLKGNNNNADKRQDVVNQEHIISVYRPKILSVVHPQLRLMDRPFDKLRQLVRKLCHCSRAGVLLPTGPALEELGRRIHGMHIAIHGYEMSNVQLALLEALQIHCVLIWDTLHKFGENHFGRLIHVSPALSGSDGTCEHQTKLLSLPGFARTNIGNDNHRFSGRAAEQRQSSDKGSKVGIDENYKLLVSNGKADLDRESSRSDGGSTFNGPKSTESPFYASASSVSVSVPSLSNGAKQTSDSRLTGIRSDMAFASDPTHHNWESIELMVEQSIYFSEQLPYPSSEGRDDNRKVHFRSDTALLIMHHVLDCIRSIKKGIELGIYECLSEFLPALKKFEYEFSNLDPLSNESESDLWREAVFALSSSPLLAWLEVCRTDELEQILNLKNSRVSALEELLMGIAHNIMLSTSSFVEDNPEGQGKKSSVEGDLNRDYKITIVAYDQESVKKVFGWLKEHESLKFKDIESWESINTKPVARADKPDVSNNGIAVFLMTSQEAATNRGRKALIDSDEVIWFSAVDILHLAGYEYESRALENLSQICEVEDYEIKSSRPSTSVRERRPQCHILATNAQASSFLELRRADQMLLSAMQLVQSGDASLEEYLADIVARSFTDRVSNFNPSELGTPSPASILHTLCIGLCGKPPCFVVKCFESSELPEQGQRQSFKSFVSLPSELSLNWHSEDEMAVNNGNQCDKEDCKNLAKTVGNFSFHDFPAESFEGSVSNSESEARDAAAEKALAALMKSGIVAAYWQSRRQITIAQQFYQNVKDGQHLDASNREIWKTPPNSACKLSMAQFAEEDQEILNGLETPGLKSQISSSPNRNMQSPTKEDNSVPIDLPPSPFIEGAVSSRDTSGHPSRHPLQSSLTRNRILYGSKGNKHGIEISSNLKNLGFGSVPYSLKNKESEVFVSKTTQNAAARKLENNFIQASDGSNLYLCRICGIKATSAEHIAEHYKGKQHQINMERLEKQAQATSNKTLSNEHQNQETDAMEYTHADSSIDECNSPKEKEKSSLRNTSLGSPLRRLSTIDRLPSTLSDVLLRRSSSLNSFRASSGNIYEGFPCVRVGETILPSSMDFRAFLEEMQQVEEYCGPVENNSIDEEAQGKARSLSFGDDTDSQVSGQQKHTPKSSEKRVKHVAGKTFKRNSVPATATYGRFTPGTNAKFNQNMANHSFSSSQRQFHSPTQQNIYPGVNIMQHAPHSPLSPTFPSVNPAFLPGCYIVGEQSNQNRAYTHSPVLPYPIHQVQSFPGVFHYVPVPMMYSPQGSMQDASFHHVQSTAYNYPMMGNFEHRQPSSPANELDHSSRSPRNHWNPRENKRGS